ncbi:MAG: antitoxin HicB [Acidipropionibacterium sp.]|jgi:hypothetical protein|nr:antitoxin HicB [Acidipropionibacterium sp.]
MSSITVTATRWQHGWELWIDVNHVTQSRTLADAEQQVRDYLDTEYEDVDHSDWNITIVPDIDGYRDVIEARKASVEAAEAQHQAAIRTRDVVRALRAQGISTTDCSVILGVSRGRISQLANG